MNLDVMWLKISRYIRNTKWFRFKGMTIVAKMQTALFLLHVCLGFMLVNE